ncbi:ferredoxin reductase [Bordetella petrii]|nr:ferredoxin reductase [Bordetella petrii]
MQRIVIVGGGHAASQLCASLAEAGLRTGVTLVSAEAHLPYHRPPLSKGYLKDTQAAPQLLRPESAYEGMTVHLNARAEHIDAEARKVTLSDGQVLPYDALVLATGTRPRRLPGLPETLDNLHYLRSIDDALRLRVSLAEARSVTVLGGGFIGLEIAATAAALGKRVTVFEMADRLLARAVSPDVSEHVANTLLQAGITLRRNCGPIEFQCQQRRVDALICQGETHPADLLVAGIGAEPDTALAQSAGLAIDNGIAVDGHMRTSAAHIYAIGDCVSFPYARWNRRLRLESVQNANDQARTLAALLLEQQPAPYAAVPWFWSDLGSLRLQMAGLAPQGAERVTRPGAKPGSFSILHFAQGRLACVESINAPVDHIAARKLLEKDELPGQAVLADPAIPLKTHL